MGQRSFLLNAYMKPWAGKHAMCTRSSSVVDVTCTLLLCR
jgi:hypothetical protein